MSSSEEEPQTPKNLAQTATLTPIATVDVDQPNKLRFSGINVPSLTMGRYGDAGQVVEDECLLQLEALNRNEEDGNEDESGVVASPQYRNTLCSIAPEAAVKARLLDVGTDYDTEIQVNRDYEHDQDIESKSKKAFGDTLSEFYVWRRWKELSADAVLFSPNEELSKRRFSSVMHRRPTLLGERDTHQRFLPSYDKGVLDDHFFLLALNAVITNSQQFSSIFASVEHLNKGMATFRFFDSATKAPKFITIDTLLPCAKDVLVGQPQLAVGRTDARNEFWLAFLQKAYATFAGSYAHLHRGSSCEILRHLTGADLTNFRWNSQRINTAAKMDLWWFLQEAMRLNQPVIATCSIKCSILSEAGQEKIDDNEANSSPQHPAAIENTDLNRVDDQDLSQLPRFNWSNGVVVHFAVDYDKSQEKTDYANIRERRLEPNVFHMIKVTTVYPESSQSTELRRQSWSEESTKWNEVSRQKLSNPAGEEEDSNSTPPAGADETNKKVAWLTLDEFVAAFDTVVMVNNASDETEVVSRFAEAVPCKHQEHGIKLPHFLLSVSKPDDVAADNGEWAQGIDYNYKSIYDLKPNELDLGEETDDDVDNMAQSCTTTSSQRSSVVDVNFTSPNVLIVEANLSFPVTPFPVPFAVQAFRVPRAERQKPVKQVRDGAISYNLPVHSRVTVSELKTETTTTFRFEAEVNTGFYNLVVVPERDLVEPIKFSLTVVKRQNAENYKIEMEELPNVTPTA